MDDTKPEAKPMTEGDIAPPPADTTLTPAAPLKDTGGVTFTPDAPSEEAEGSATDAAPAASARDQVRQGAQRLTSQAGDTARGLVDQGKARATDALGQVSQLLEDAAQQVDERLGGHYGDYARQIAGQVQGLSDGIESRSAEDLLEDVRGFVRRSPGVAIGVAATLGFAVARLASAGLDHWPATADA